MDLRKQEIIERVFKDPSRWSGTTLVRPVVTLAEIQEAIHAHNATPGARQMSSRNPANFFKDFVRNIATANARFPTFVLLAGYTGKQLTGGGNSFEFVPLPAGQATAFPSSAGVYPRNPAAAQIVVAQTLSLPILNKALARADENWLQSIAVSLHLPQHHLAIHPKLGMNLVEVGHMQSNVKLAKTEIDGLFYGRLDNGELVLVTMEAKGPRDDILETQVMDQVGAVQRMPAVKNLVAALKADPAKTIILPMAMKVVSAASHSSVTRPYGFVPIGKNLIYMADYEPVAFLAARPAFLTLGGETLFDMRPPIDGINK